MLLVDLEDLLNKSKRKSKQNIYDFVGIISDNDADTMRKAIGESCGE